jgi:hypothetical protein
LPIMMMIYNSWHTAGGHYSFTKQDYSFIL